MGGNLSTRTESSRQNDWTCECGKLNFGSRQKCYDLTCGKWKPGGRTIGSYHDWICENCGYLNHAKYNRQTCRSCDGPKTKGEYVGDYND